MPDELKTKIQELHDKFPVGQPIRVCSSSNLEDKEDFNGAGLHSSHTHRLEEGPLAKTVAQTLASLYSFRSFEERDFYRISHADAGMGLAVHNNFDNERATGVAVTKNMIDPNWEGFYINVAPGELSVTNPEDGITPDEMVISKIGLSGEFERQFLRHSNKAVDKQPILSDAHTKELVDAMQTLQAHFSSLHPSEAGDVPGYEIEFKIDEFGQLIIKQLRPWID